MGVTSEILIYAPRRGKHITGGVIKGIVKFHLDKDTVYDKVSLSLVEKGICEWYEYESAYRPSFDHSPSRKKVGNRYQFENKEENNVMKLYFLNREIDEKSTALSAGSYEYPFQMDIPEDIPASIKTNTGEIKYKLVLKFKKPEVLSWNKKFKTRITIYPKVDSSLTEEPIIANLDKTLFKLFSTKKHEIKCDIEIDRQYLINSGERKISFNVTNDTKTTFSIKTELLCKKKYIDRYGYTKKNVKTVDYCTVETPSIPEKSVSSMFNMIPVPDDQCTIRYSKVIAREYKIKVTLKLPLPHVNSSIEIPVFVGEGANNEETGETAEPMEDPPSYWEVMAEDKSKE